MKAQICRKNSHRIHLIHVCFDWLTFLNIYFWCNIFQMQPRWKMYKQLFRQICTICLHTLQPIYNLWISALYVLYHSVFHTSTGFSIKLVIPHVLPLLLPPILVSSMNTAPAFFHGTVKASGRVRECKGDSYHPAMKGLISPPKGTRLTWVNRNFIGIQLSFSVQKSLKRLPLELLVGGFNNRVKKLNSCFTICFFPFQYISIALIMSLTSKFSSGLSHSAYSLG